MFRLLAGYDLSHLDQIIGYNPVGSAAGIVDAPPVTRFAASALPVIRFPDACARNSGAELCCVPARILIRPIPLLVGSAECPYRSYDTHAF